MKKCLLIILLAVLSNTLIAQKRLYRIDWKEDSIGYLVVDKTQSGSLTTYRLKSISEFSMLLTFNVLTEYHSVYREGKLLSGSSRSVLNEKERSVSSVKYLQNQYQVIVDDEVSNIYQDITESITTLYFYPPRGSSIFSERYGKFCKIEKIDEGHYKLVKPDNRKNDYMYDHGVCEKVVVDLPMATISMTLIE